jgi:hypothetical protein
MINYVLEGIKAFVEHQGQDYWIGRHTLEDRMSHTGGKLEMLSQYGNLQIERVTHPPYGLIPLHRHPDVDTYEFPLWGSGELWIGRRKFILDDKTTPWCPMFISRKWFHGGKGYERGGCFLSVQYWHIQPVQSITKNWIRYESV